MPKVSVFRRRPPEGRRHFQDRQQAKPDTTDTLTGTKSRSKSRKKTDKKRHIKKSGSGRPETLAKPYLFGTFGRPEMKQKCTHKKSAKNRT